MFKKGTGIKTKILVRAGTFMIVVALALAGLLFIPATPANALPSPEDVVKDVLEKTGIDKIAVLVKTLVDSVAQEGSLPMVGSLPELIQDPNVMNCSQDIVGQLTQVSQILQKLAESGNIVFTILEAIPFDFTVEFDLPNNLGRVWARKADTIALCLRVNGPNGAQAEFGVADDDPLGNGNATQFANPDHKPFAFLDLTNITNGTLCALLEAGTSLSDSFLKLNYYVLSGQMDSDKANAEIARLENDWNTKGKTAVNNIIQSVGAAVDQTNLNISLSVDLAGSKKMTADNKAGSTTNMFSEDITIPAGKLGNIFMDSDFLPDTVKGLSILLGQLTSGKIPQAAPPELSKLGDLADSIADGTTISVAMMTPALVQVTEEVSAKPFFNWIKNNVQSAVKFVGALQQAADAGSLAAMGSSQLGDNLYSLVNDLGGDLYLGLNLGVGANADLGAEGVVSVGAGAAAHIKTNPEMLLLLGTGGYADLPNATGQADMGFDVSMDAGAGVSLGEGVEVEASGGVGFSTSLLNVGLTEWDDPVPQIYGPPASSNANLSDLKVRVGVQEYTASPDKNTSGLYTVWVPTGTTSVTIVPKTFSSRATFVFSGYGQMMNGAAINYTLRKTTWEDIPFSVQAEDGTGKNYILRIQISPSTRLQSLTASKGAWDKAFSPGVTDYKLTVDSDTDSPESAHSDPQIVAGGGRGQAQLPSGGIQLGNNSVIDLAAGVETASGGQITVGGQIQNLDSFTGGDLNGVNLSAPQSVGGHAVQVEKAVRMESSADNQPILITNNDVAGVTASIPDGTTVLAPAGWDGTIIPPKAGQSSGTSPSGFIVGNTVIEVGSPGAVLLFDKPVTLTLTGVTGPVGYKPAGSDNWVQITRKAGGTYDNPEAPPFPGEAYISNGVDTKIITWHFTSFAGLVAQSPPSNGDSGGDGGYFTLLPVSSATGTAMVAPDAGGKVSLGSEAVISIPAGALSGNSAVSVTIRKVISPPAAPAGLMAAGSVFEFSVDNRTGYTFAKPGTLTFAFDPAAVPQGRQPSVYYYDETAKQWVNIGGTVSGNTITVTVDHFPELLRPNKECL